VKAAGTADGIAWYATPWIDARSLDQLLAEDGLMTLRSCRHLVEQLSSALQYCHRRGAVHGDLQPANVLIRSDGWVLLAGAGLPAPAAPRSPRLTAYQAPEVKDGAPLRPAADQYALAVLTHECLSGAPPAVAGTPDEPGAANPRVALPRFAGTLPRAGLPESVIPPLRRALAPAPADRFPSVAAFVAALDAGSAPPAAPVFVPAPRASEPRVLTMEPESRRGRVLAFLAVLLLLGGAAFGYQRFRDTERGKTLADRFDRWYELDAPPGGMVMEVPRAAPAPPESTVAPVKPVQRTPAPTRPRAVPTPRVREPEPEPAPPPADPGRLFISSVPWGTLSVDGRVIGNTPMANLSISAGTHFLRITHDGFEPYERQVEVAPGQQVRLIGIQLQEKR
jgi:serine/threonine-protein kinase